MFQSTRPRGARRTAANIAATPSIVSIHAPAGGATRGTLGGNGDNRVSIHAPAGGATGKLSLVVIKRLFQSTRPRGARRGQFVFEFADARFQSTRPRGARLLSIYALNSQYITYTISRTFSFASLLIYYSIYFFCKYFITRFCDPTSFLATLHVRVH